MSQGHLLALARYARLTNEQTQRHATALDVYWTAATDTGGTASAPLRSGGAVSYTHLTLPTICSV
eukprot:5754626-Alexandrium_andersonii.AAC.1